MSPISRSNPYTRIARLPNFQRHPLKTSETSLLHLLTESSCLRAATSRRGAKDKVSTEDFLSSACRTPTRQPRAPEGGPEIRVGKALPALTKLAVFRYTPSYGVVP